MKLYVGITDTDWFRYLRERNAEEMNFWRPRATTKFKILEQNELFLFKSKYPENMIVGGAFFVRHTTLPLDLAWKAFGEANGMPTLQVFRQKIQALRHDQEFNPVIGCTICQPTSKTAPLPTPKSAPPPSRFVASFPGWFRLGCAGGASACSWFSWLVALVVFCR